MHKILASHKFQELIKKFDAPPPSEHKQPRKQSEKDDVPPNVHKQHRKQAEKDEAPPSVRKSARDIRQPRRFESPISLSRPKLPRATPVVRRANRAKENVTPPPRGPSRSKVTRQEPDKSMSRPPKNDSRRTEKPARSKSHLEKPVDRSNANHVERAERQDDSNSEDFFDSASAPRSPLRGRAFSKVGSRLVDRGSPSKGWSDSQFLQPAPATRDPRVRNANRNDISGRRQFTTNDFDSGRRDPHPMYSRPEVSMRHLMQSRDSSMRQPMQTRDASMRQPMHSRNPPKRQPMHSRDFSMRPNVVEPEASKLSYQPYVRLSDISRTRDFTQRWDNDFRRPQTPPEDTCV